MTNKTENEKGIFDTTDLDDLIKEKVKPEKHFHFDGQISDKGIILNTGDFNPECKVCLEIQELYAKQEERQRLKAEVEKVLDEMKYQDEFSEEVVSVEELKKRLFE